MGGTGAAGLVGPGSSGGVGGVLGSPGPLLKNERGIDRSSPSLLPPLEMF